MKRSANIKDLIMMPPPKARPKSRSDTSEELRKNLTESITNISDNSALQEEIQKFFKENEELEQRKNDDELSISKSNSSDKIQLLPSYLMNSPNCRCLTKEIPNSSNNLAYANKQILLKCKSCNHSSQYIQDNLKNSFNFNLINYNYNYTQISDEEESLESFENLKRNLIIRGDGINQVSNKNFSGFSTLPPPKNKKEIKIFVNNLLQYISLHEFDSPLLVLKIKIQTRDNDFKNKGLKIEYYRESLIKMQKELVSRICMFHEEKEKIEQGSYEMLKKKRKRNIQVEKSSSSSSEKSESSPN
jgi:hypothetical protein